MITPLLPARTPMNYVSLFSGIGGFDIGFDRAGMHCKMQVEFNEHASAVLAHHWPDVERLKDVRDVKRDSFRAVDLICGGFPCQDVSVAGRRAGLAGERSGLWFEFLRIITEHTPRWVVIENVPGLLSSNRGRDFAVIIDGLVKCGYRVAWRVLDAQYFGVPQRRRRVFIVASLGNGGCAEVLFERDGSYGNPPPSREAGQGTTPYVIKGTAIGRRPENGPQYGEVTEDGTVYTLNTSEVHAVAGTLAASGAGSQRPAGQANEVSFLIPMVASTVARGEGQGKERGDGCDNLIVATPVAFNWQNSPSRSMAVDEYSPTLETDKVPAITYGLRADITPKWLEECSPTLLTPSPSGGGHSVEVANHYGVRRLTPTECERLQGFPDGHTAVNGQSDSARYKQLGNAVCVNVAEWLGRRIAAVDASA